MSFYNLNDEVWFFYVESTSGYLYPDWLDLCKGRVIWKSPYEEIMHVYIDGEKYIHILLDDIRHVFSSKKEALESISNRLRVIEHE
jgi:hypothetical protein